MLENDNNNITNEENVNNEIIEEEKNEKCYYYEQVKKGQKRNRYKPYIKYIVTCLIISMAGGGSFGIGLGWAQNYFAKPLPSDVEIAPVSSAPYATATSANTSMSKKDVIKTVMPSVVSISTKIVEDQVIWGIPSGTIEGTGAGSGIVFYEDDEKVGIVTNNHVIQGATEVVTIFDGDKEVNARVVGKDKEAEIAVLTVSKEDLKEAGVEQITVAKFGDSDEVEVGDDVYAIGNALGEGLTATDGMISAVDKEVKVQGSTLKNVLQTNAAINQGNSGGALVNTKGEVIGINTAKSVSGGTAEGIGYAIPSNSVSEIAEILLVDGTVPKPGMGIIIQNISSQEANLYRLPVGVIVLQVLPDGSAEKAGMKQGDIIVEINNKKVMNTNDLSDILKDLKVGETASVYVVRDGNTSVDLEVVIGDMNEFEE